MTMLKAETVITPSKRIGFRLNLVLLGVLCFYLITTAYSIYILKQQAIEFKSLADTHFERAIHAAELSRDAEQIASQALEKMVIQDYSKAYYQSVNDNPGDVFNAIRSKLYASTAKEQTILDEIDSLSAPYFNTLKILDGYLLNEYKLERQQKLVSKSLTYLQASIPTGQELSPGLQYFSNLFLKTINVAVLVRHSTSQGELQKQRNDINTFLAQMYYMDNIPALQKSLLNDLQQTAGQALDIRYRFQNQHLATLAAIRQTRLYAQRLSTSSFDFYQVLKNATQKATLEHDALVKTVITNIVLFCVGFLILTGFAYWFIHHYLIHRLDRLNSVMMKHVEGINAPIPKEGNDEISIMGRAFSIFVEATEKAQKDSLDAKQEVENANAKLLAMNESLQTLSHTDDLTQLANRRYFFQRFAQDWQKAIQLKQGVSLIMIDLDWFKAYNDYYGHQAGDKCLFQVSQQFKKEAEKFDGLVARYGGEEFIILLLKISKEESLKFAQNLGNKIKQLQIPHANSPKGIVTLSLGTVSHIPQKGENLDVLIHCADQALYNAKNNGRDQVFEGHIDKDIVS